MRIQRLAVATLALIGVAACSKDKGGHSTGAVTPPLAYIRYFNAVGDTLSLDFHAIDQIEFSQPFLAVPFRGIGLGSYQGYQAGSRKIRVFPNSTDIATTSKFLVDDAYAERWHVLHDHPHWLRPLRPSAQAGPARDRRCTPDAWRHDRAPCDSCGPRGRQRGPLRHEHRG